MFRNYIILSDLDGTLLNKKGEVSKENLEAIEYFIENQGRFGVATGRSYDNAKKYIDNLPINNYSVFLNGSILFDYEKKENIKHFNLQKKAVYDFMKKVIDSKKIIAIEISTLDKTYFEEISFPAFEDKLEYQRPYEVASLDNLFEMEWLKALLFVQDKEDLVWLEEESRYLENDKIVTRVQSGEKYFELLPFGVSKGAMLDEIRSLTNDQRKIIAVGDYYNDLEMVRRADVGVFTSEANLDLQKEADYITVDCDSHVLKDIIYNENLFKKE